MTQSAGPAGGLFNQCIRTGSRARDAGPSGQGARKKEVDDLFFLVPNQ